MSKACTKCKKEKTLNEFYTFTRPSAKGDKTYVRSHCKQCKYERNKIWQKANRDKYRRHVRDAMRRKRAGIKRKLRQTHEEIQAKRNAYQKKRRKEDPIYKMRCTLRRRLRKALKGNTKSASTFKLLGTTVEHLRQHLEVQFLPGMNWQNHGKGKDKWVVDHIMPCASFDFTKKDQQQMCFHWTNLQPLWDPDNNAKRDKVPENRLWVDSTTGWVDVEPPQ